MIIRFDKYKGLEVHTVPPSYASWLLNQMKDNRLNIYTAKLAAELMKTQVPLEELDTRVSDSVNEYHSRFPHFNIERMKRLLGTNQGRKLRLLWLGVEHYDHQLNRVADYHASIDKPELHPVQ